MKNKINDKAKNLINSYENQGWSSPEFEFDKQKLICIFSLKHVNGNLMRIKVDYCSNKILVYVNDKLKDSLIIK